MKLSIIKKNPPPPPRPKNKRRRMGNNCSIRSIQAFLHSLMELPSTDLSPVYERLGMSQGNIRAMTIYHAYPDALARCLGIVTGKL